MQTLPHRQKRTFKKRSCTGAPGCLLLLLWASPNKQSHLATSCCFRPSPASHKYSFKHTAYCLATQPHSTTGSFFIKSQLKFNERKKKCEIWKWQKKSYWEIQTCCARLQQRHSQSTRSIFTKSSVAAAFRVDQNENDCNSWTRPKTRPTTPQKAIWNTPKRLP